MAFDSILVNNDIAIFLPTFGLATVAVRAGRITATGHASYANNMVCVSGDQRTVQVPACDYTAPPYTVKGTGTLKIAFLAANQTATKTSSNNKKVLMKGSFFTARFTVSSPAKMPEPASSPDPTPLYYGKGFFLTRNTRWKGK